MAKVKPNFKKLQREMLERIAKQRKNRDNWSRNYEVPLKKER